MIPVPPLIYSDSINSSIQCNNDMNVNNLNVNGDLIINGTIDLGLNQLEDVTIINPVSGQVLKYDGIVWVNDDETISAGGLNTQIQFNNNGLLDGSSNLTWDGELNVNSTINCNVITDGQATLTNGTLSGLNTPIGMTDAVNKSYVDNTVMGVTWKNAVSCASVSAVNLASPGSTIDGLTLMNGNRILIKDGSTINPGSLSVDNGIYIFDTSSTPLTRSTDMPNGSSASGVAVFSEGGIDNNGVGFVCNTPPPNSIVGTNQISFVKFNTADVIIAGDGLSKSADILNVNVDNTTIDISISNDLKLADSGVVPGSYSNPNLNVDTYGRITSIISITPVYYMTLTGVFNNLTSAATRFINWGVVPNSETISNPILLGRNGTIKMISITYTNTAALTIAAGVTISFNVGYLPTGSNPNTGFTIFSGGSNIITWNNSNNGTWPSSSVELSIPVSSTTQLTMRSNRSAAVTPTTADANVLILIEFTI